MRNEQPTPLHAGPITQTPLEERLGKIAVPYGLDLKEGLGKENANDEIERLKEALRKIVAIEKNDPWCFQHVLVEVAKQALKDKE